jgi:hypothetical protein
MHSIGEKKEKAKPTIVIHPNVILRGFGSHNQATGTHLCNFGWFSSALEAITKQFEDWKKEQHQNQ